MNYDSFLSTPRWEILQILAEKPSSPIEIAEKLGTTVSYASQQLTLLSAAGIVFKKKTGNNREISILQINKTVKGCLKHQ